MVINGEIPVGTLVQILSKEYYNAHKDAAGFIDAMSPVDIFWKGMSKHCSQVLVVAYYSNSAYLHTLEGRPTGYMWSSCHFSLPNNKTIRW